MQIRVAKETDVQQMNAIYREVSHEGTHTLEPISADHLTATSRRPAQVWFVAENAGGLLGVGDAHPLASKPSEAVLRIFIGRAYRRQGVGSALIQALVSWAETEGFEKVVAYVTAGNDPSLSLIRKLGFSRVSAPGSALKFEYLLS